MLARKHTILCQIHNKLFSAVVNEEVIIERVYASHKLLQYGQQACMSPMQMKPNTADRITSPTSYGTASIPQLIQIGMPLTD